MNQSKELSPCCQKPYQFMDCYYEGNRLIGIFICPECKKDYKLWLAEISVKDMELKYLKLVFLLTFLA